MAPCVLLAEGMPLTHFRDGGPHHCVVDARTGWIHGLGWPCHPESTEEETRPGTALTALTNAQVGLIVQDAPGILQEEARSDKALGPHSDAHAGRAAAAVPWPNEQ